MIIKSFEDLCLVAIDEWIDEVATLAKNLQEEFGVMQSESIEYNHYSAQEYPETPYSIDTEPANGCPVPLSPKVI